MLLNQSPRGSFSVPVNITLQGARRRHMRDVFYHQAQLQEIHWRKEREKNSNEKTRAQIPESSVGEDRAILLGFTMMTFSILLFFLVGIAMVKPCVDSDWDDLENCSLLQVEFLNETMNGCSTSYRCLNVLVMSTSRERRLRLQYDEDVVKTNPKCFYSPKRQQSKTQLETEAKNVQQTLMDLQGESLRCYLSASNPNNAILQRKCSVKLVFYYLLWPSLMLQGGILLVGLVKLNQHLALLCSEISRVELLGKPSKLTEGGIYRLLRWRPGSLVEQQDTFS